MAVVPSPRPGNPGVWGTAGQAPSRPPRPGPDYVWNGRRWVKKSPPRTGTNTTGVSWAEREAQRIVDAQLAAIEAQQKAWQESLQAEAARRAEQARAFARMVQGMGFDQRIQGVYSAAAHDLSGIASGFAGETRDVALADAAEQRQMLSGTGQEGAVREQGTNMGDVLYGVGGWIPSKSLGEQGAAYAADAALQPSFMLQQGLLEAERDYAEKSAQNPFLDAILEVKLGKQDLVQSLRDERTELNFKQQEMRLKQIESDRDYWLKMQAFYLSQKKYKLAAAAEKRARDAETRYANETAGRDAFGEVLPDYYQDGQGRIVPKGYVYNKKGELVRKPTAGSGNEKGEGGLTANEQQAQLERTYKAEDDILKLARTLAKQYNWRPSAGQATSRAIRNKIAAEIRRRYGWVTTTKSKKALAEIIGRVLDSLARLGPPAPDGPTGSGSTGSGAFD